MKAEVWTRNGQTTKFPECRSLKVGTHVNIGDGKTYLSVQINDNRLMLNAVLVNVREDEEFAWNDLMALPDEFIRDEEMLQYWRKYKHCQEHKRLRRKRDEKD